MFCKCLSLPFCSFSNFSNTFLFFCFDFSPTSKISWQKIHFSSFHFLVFTLMFPVLFSLLMFLSKRSDGRGRNTSPREMSEASGDNGQQSLKRRSFVGVFFSAWTKVSVDGPESTKENALADDFWVGLAAIVCFLWLSELCVTQTVRGTPASECLSSSPYVLSLSPLWLYVYPPSSTRGKKLLERLANLRRWGWTWTIKWSVSKIKGRRSC